MRLSFSTKALGAIAGVAMLSATMSAPASAFTLASPSIGDHFSAGQVDKVWWGWRGGGWGWRGGWGYRPWGWGYRPWGWRGGWGWGPGAFAAGAVVGTAAAAAAYNGCWRRVWGPYGWQWARVC